MNERRIPLIKVLIVEDNKLIRKGLIVSMPWSDFDMSVVGESSDGQGALDFLQDNQVDLVLTDLEMPIMSGLEFIKIASSLYPNINFVILTIYTDFDYIRQALSLGAIDYIAKVQFDKENFHSILERISKRLHKVTANDISNLDLNKKKILSPFIYTLLSMEETKNGVDFAKEFIELNHLSDKKIEVGAGIYILSSSEEKFIFPDYFPNCILLKINGVLNLALGDLISKLYKYKKSQFFYDYTPSNPILIKDVTELAIDSYISSDEDFHILKERWLSFQWIHHTDLFHKIKFDLKESKLTAAKLYHLMVALENAWNLYYGNLYGTLITIPDSFHSWFELENWLETLYQKTDFSLHTMQFSEEINDSIRMAKQIIDKEYRNQLLSSDIANRIHMSRSYFNQCFKQMIGESFGNYLRNIRIQKAKEFLEQTNKSIQWIASHTGYEDEKYFSRIFKKETGMNPSDYRKNYR